MSWTEVLRISASGMPVGVSADGEWDFQDVEGQWAALSVRPPPLLVSVLESESDVFGALLRSRLSALHLDSQLAERFPILGAVRMGLTWPGGSGHWQAHVLRWVESLQNSAEFGTELHLLTRQGASQAIRHRSRRLVRASIT